MFSPLMSIEWVSKWSKVFEPFERFCQMPKWNLYLIRSIDWHVTKSNVQQYNFTKKSIKNTNIKHNFCSNIFYKERQQHLLLIIQCGYWLLPLAPIVTQWSGELISAWVFVCGWAVGCYHICCGVLQQLAGNCIKWTRDPHRKARRGCGGWSVAGDQDKGRNIDLGCLVIDEASLLLLHCTAQWATPQIQIWSKCASCGR